MNKYSLMMFVLVLVLLLSPAEIVEEDIQQNIEKRVNFLLIRLPIVCEIHLLSAKCLINLCDLVSIKVNLSHNILIQF